MPFKVEQLPDEPIVVCSYHEPLDPLQDIVKILDQVSQLAAHIDGPVYRIIDNRDLHLTFDKMVLLMAEETKGKPGSVSDPRMITIMVTNHDLAQLGAKSMREQEQYGKHPVAVFESLENALAHIREEIALVNR